MIDNNQKHTISLLVANKPGVLIRISLVFARRGFNIDSLVVSESMDPRFSTMNIVAVGDARSLGQILGQLNKLVDVVHAHDRTNEDIIQRELALLKIKANQEQRVEILTITQAMGCEILDVSNDALVVQIQGNSEKLDSTITLLSGFGVMELVRTGKLLMAKGPQATAF